MIIYIWFLILLSPVLADELLVADLKGSLVSLDDISCIRTDGSSNEDDCEKTENICMFEGFGKSFDQVEIFFDKKAEKLPPAFSKEFKGSIKYFLKDYNPDVSPELRANVSEKISFNKKFPVDAEITIFTVDFKGYTKNIRILKNTKITSSGSLGAVDDDEQIYKIKFLVPHNKKDIDSASIKIFSEESFVNLGSIELHFSAGNFPVTIHRDLGSGIKEKQSFILPIGPSHGKIPTDRIIQVDDKKFKKVIRTERVPSLSWGQELTNTYPKQIPALYLQKEVDEKKTLLIKEIKKFTVISNGNHDLTAYLQLKNNEVVVNNEKKDEFFNLINKHPAYKMKLEGMCNVLTKKDQEREIEVFISPENDAKILGKIHVIRDTGNNFSTIFKDLNDKKFNVQFNMVEQCDPDSELEILHVVRQKEYEFLNFGKGPWGESGWVKAVNYRYINTYSNFFATNGLNWARISQPEEGFVTITGHNPDLKPGDPDEEKHIIDIKVKADSLWGANGTFLPQRDCRPSELDGVYH